MNEAVAFPDRPAGQSTDRIAVALELVPLAAMLTPFVAILTIRWEDLDVEAMLLRAAAVALASGLGWLKLGRPAHAVGVAVARGGALALLVWWSYASVSAEVAVRQCESACDATNPVIPSIVPVALVAIVFVVSTIASAALVARASGRRTRMPAASPAGARSRAT